MGRRIETIPSEVMEALVRYPWPGNVRELQNVIERAVILSPGSVLQVPLGDLQTVPEQSPSQASQDSVPVTLVDAEREHILAASRKPAGCWAGRRAQPPASGMKRSTLHWKMQKLGITRPELAPARWRRRSPAGAPTLALSLHLILRRGTCALQVLVPALSYDAKR